MPPNVDLTPWALALAIAGAIFGKDLASLIGAYGLIIVGWFAGLLYGLFTRAPESKLPVWAYAVFTLIVCIMVTVPVATAAVAYIPGVKVEYTNILGVVAAAIPAFPDRWGTWGAWLLEKWQAIKGSKSGANP